MEDPSEPAVHQRLPTDNKPSQPDRGPLNQHSLRAA